MEEARKHPTCRYRVDNYMKPTVLTHQFIRAEIRGNWLFQQLCLERMLPYLLRAGQFHYARYILWHLLDMRYLLPPKAKAHLLAGAHVCWRLLELRIGRPVWWTDCHQYRERWFERNNSLTGAGHWKDRFIPNLSVRIRCHGTHVLSADQLPNTSSQTKHKEEGNKRRKLEFDDRETLSSELAKHSHPVTVQSEVLYKSVNGGWCSRHWTYYGRFISQHLAEWLSR